MIALILAMRFVPSIIGYGYGVGYASGFLNIFPNVNGFIDSYRDSMVYVSNFPVQYQQYMGGSYIGELYFNFGYFSVIFAILIGIFIGFICNMVSNKNNYDKSLSYIICLIIYTNMLWWIRDYFSGMIREIIWSAIIIIILNVIANTIFFKINKE